jgi:hypothetical protein
VSLKGLEGCEENNNCQIFLDNENNIIILGSNFVGLIGHMA